jgi:carbamoyltransferase
MLYLGTARARLGPAAAVIDADRGAVAACEENRLTRAVESGTVGPPELATRELLRFIGRERDDVRRTVDVEDGDGANAHLAHAVYALHASRLADPLIVVCGSDISAWVPDAAPQSAGTLRQVPVPDAPRLADEYGTLVASLGFRPAREEHLVEALARGGHPEASALQRRLADQLLALLDRLKAETGKTTLCLSGGLFFNTFFTSAAAAAGLFDEVYLPPHPGRNGAAVGAALLGADQVRPGAPGAGQVRPGADQVRPGALGAGQVRPGAPGAEQVRPGALGAEQVRPGAIGSAYLGPSYSDEEIKATLENCKLSFDLLHEDRLFDLVLHQLSRGRLIGWYHGRLEWGPRALGHRSVLADPFAPHVLENLNGFLKRRPAFRAYGVSIPAARLADVFETASPGAGQVRPGAEQVRPGALGAHGSHRSAFMQYEYRPRDLDKFKTILPAGVTTLRVQTVDESEPRFLRLLEAWGEKTGMPVLVNTSFNGFHEPLVCSPRDAIRVFYGTGLDVLALENFVLRK